MSKSESIFHRLQKDRAKSLKASGIKEGVTLDYSPFIEKISNHYNDPFPIFRLKYEDSRTLENRFRQIVAAEGLSMVGEMSDHDELAGAELLFEENFNTAIPARRFGIEIYTDTEAIGFVFEAMKNINIPYSVSECMQMKIRDCRRLRIHTLTKLPTEDDIILESMSAYFTPKPSFKGENKNLEFASLYSDAIKVKAVPSTGTKIGLDNKFGIENILHLPPKETYPEYADKLSQSAIAALTLLWALEREPKLIIKSYSDFKDKNSTRRLRKMPPFSPICTVEIDQDELRKRETHLAAEIATALKNNGGYKIPSLVLVKGYTRKDTGQIIKDYARCADDIVRTEASYLLQIENYEELAALVRDFGNRRTQQRFDTSKLHDVRMV